MKPVQSEETTPQTPATERMSWSSVEFLEQPSSRIFGWSILAVFATFLFCLGLSFVIKTNISFEAGGETEPAAGVSDARALLSGQIQEVFVSRGSSVKKDDLIAVLRIEGATEKQLRALQKEMKAKISKLDHRKLMPTLGLSHEFILDAQLKSIVTDVDRKYTAYYRSHFFDAKTASQQLAPLKKREKVLAEHLSYIEKSSVKDFLAMQKGSLEDERDKIRQEIARLDGDQTTSRFVTKDEVVRSMEIADSALETYISKFQIRATGDGTIARLDIHEGSSVSGDQVVAAIVPDSPAAIANIMVSSEDISKVKIGDDSKINIDAYPVETYGTFTGKVLSVERVQANDAKKNAGYYGVRVSIDLPTEKPEIKLNPGLKVRAVIISKRVPIATLVARKLFGVLK